MSRISEQSLTILVSKTWVRDRQYHLEVSLALTEEEGNQMIGELAGRDRAESLEVFWEGSMDLGPEYDDNLEV